MLHIGDVEVTRIEEIVALDAVSIFVEWHDDLLDGRGAEMSRE